MHCTYIAERLVAVRVRDEVFSLRQETIAIDIGRLLPRWIAMVGTQINPMHIDQYHCEAFRLCLPLGRLLKLHYA